MQSLILHRFHGQNSAMGISKGKYEGISKGKYEGISKGISKGKYPIYSMGDSWPYLRLCEGILPVKE